MNIRIGHGFDVHKFGGDKPLILGGVVVPYDTGLIAHSDGDVVLHAVSDAILGAMALGDIGKHFPDTDANFAGADSRILLKRAYQEIQALGFSVGNVDITIIAEAPKMRPYIDAMRAYIAEDLAVDISAVNVKATTTEKLGFVGRREGIAVEAVVLIFNQALLNQGNV